ncbi:MAG: DUF4013 domain-containing protein [Vicinamibacteria bacterium]
MATPPAAPTPSDTLDFGRAFRFVFDDPDWIKKMLIGGVMAFLGILIIGTLWVLGYWSRLIRRVAAGEERPLPDWEDLGGLLREGWGAASVYGIYIVGLLLPFFVAFMGVVVVGGGMSQLTRGSEEASEAFGALAGIGFLVLYALFFIVMMALMIYLPAALTRHALTGRFATGFELRENLEFIRRNLANYALALVLYMLASFVAQFGVLACCVGVFPVSFWGLCVFGWGLGETARRDSLPVR